VFCSATLSVSAREIIYASVAKGRVERFELDGTSLGGFNTVGGLGSIAVDSNLFTYTNSFLASSAYRYAPDGHFSVFAVPTQFDGEGPLFLGSAAAIGPDGKFYFGVVSDTRRVERFGSDGSSLDIIQIPLTGSGAPLDVAFDAAGNFYVAMGYSIRKFTSDGAPLGTFSSSSQLLTDIAFDSAGNLYATGGNIVIKYSQLGQLLSSFNPKVSADSIAIDSHDILYIGGEPVFGVSQSVIKKFRTDGTSLGTIYTTNVQADNLITSLRIVNVPEPAAASIGALAVAILSAMRRHRGNCRG
jgi:sugar lactone lactonase YvrE